MKRKLLKKKKPLEKKSERRIISRPPKIINFRPKPKKDEFEYVILLHKVSVANMTRKKAVEVVNSYNNEIVEDLNQFGNIIIKNIVVPCQSTEDFSIEVVYPTVDSIMEKLKSSLTIPQERKLKIFKLLEEL